MMIRDVNGQIEKAIAEIERTYSKRMKFTIYDLSATKPCEGASNFNNYKNGLQNKLSSKRIAQLYTNSQGINTYIKL